MKQQRDTYLKRTGDDAGTLLRAYGCGPSHFHWLIWRIKECERMTPYYEAGGITIYNADYREVLPGLRPAFDCLLTDPPYATTNLSWDKPIDWPFFWTEI